MCFRMTVAIGALTEFAAIDRGNGLGVSPERLAQNDRSRACPLAGGETEVGRQNLQLRRRPSAVISHHEGLFARELQAHSNSRAWRAAPPYRTPSIRPYK